MDEGRGNQADNIGLATGLVRNHDGKVGGAAYGSLGEEALKSTIFWKGLGMEDRENLKEGR